LSVTFGHTLFSLFLHMTIWQS